jgi:putative methionine-R-sulfoxide reductase with GAF domain
MKNERYEYLLKYLESSFEGERNFIANLANASAVINENLENLNWAGFYLFDKTDLVLGPFQGKPAQLRFSKFSFITAEALAKFAIKFLSPSNEDSRYFRRYSYLSFFIVL